MQIQTHQGIVTSVMMHPFTGTEETFAFRNHLFNQAVQASLSSPEYRIDIHDETLLAFDHLERALDFLASVIDLSTAKLRHAPDQVAIRCGVCYGEFFVHAEQIYGPATNLATQLSFQSRENEILIGGFECQRIQQYLGSRSHLSSAIRDESKKLVSIWLSDEDSTISLLCKRQLLIRAEGYLNKLAPQRNISLVIGRSADCDIVVDYDHVSRRHATITMKQDQLFLEDHSANGTYLYTENEEFFLAQEVVSLGHKGEISCGTRAEDYPQSTISFEFRDNGEETGEFEIYGLSSNPLP